MIPTRLFILLLLWAPLLLAACGGEDPAKLPPPAPKQSDDSPAILVNGIYNSGFEWIADGTTDPSKYGAYWLGAFVYEEGRPDDLIEEDGPFRGERFLRLKPEDGRVLQKVVGDPRWTDRTRIILAARITGGASLKVVLEDGPGRVVTAVIEKDRARWSEGDDPLSGLACRSAAAGGNGGWALYALDAGARFKRLHGNPPLPRLNVRLECEGGKGAFADVDEVYVSLPWPCLDEAALSRRIIERVLNELELWYLPPKEGGLGLVDPKSGFIKVINYNVETGADHRHQRDGQLHTLHDVLLRWLRYARDVGWKDEVKRWTPRLERFVATLLEHSFDPHTHLPRAVVLKTHEPRNNKPITVGSYVDFILRARELIGDEELNARCLERVRKTADTLIALQRAHDLPRDEVKNQLKYDAAKGRFEGKWPNWFGHIPNRITPMGVIEEPKRFNTAWAVLSGKGFWYHVFKSSSAVMAVHALVPRTEDLPAVKKVLSLYHRDWDAARYDLENDTDDHYGYLCEDLLPLLEAAEGKLPEAYRLVQDATDHRLEAAAERVDDTMWIQAVRLGTSCAGDSPRAFKGVLDLYELPSSVNPESSGKELYREALLELARNDLKGRQLTNGQFTESFFKNWEMVCICFRGSYQGDCRDHPPEFWHGDVGDTFGGPPTSAIKAQTFAYRAAEGGERQAILAALGIIEHVTDSGLRREYGYLFGLDPAVAEQYELLEKYVHGLSRNSPVGLAYTLAWLKLLPYLDASKERIDPSARIERDDGTSVVIALEGPPGGRVALPQYESDSPPFPAPLSHRDGRMAAFPLPEGWKDDVETLDHEGKGRATVSVGHASCAMVQPVLLDPAGGAPLALGEVLVIRSRDDDGS